MDQLPRLRKRELICLLFGEVSSSSGCLGWATLLPEPSYNYFKIVYIENRNIILCKQWTKMPLNIQMRMHMLINTVVVQ